LRIQSQPLNNLGRAMGPNESQTPPAFVDLATVAELFLQAKSGSGAKSYIDQLRRVLVSFLARFGTHLIGQVGSQQIREVTNNRRWRPKTRIAFLRVVKDLFSWAQANGYLSPDQPTGADSIVLRSHISPPEFLCAAELKELFGSTQSVGVLLEGALHAFGGLEVAELTGLVWSRIWRERGIAISRPPLSRARLAPITPVLDAWLLPFYGCSGRLVCDGASRREFKRWARVHNIHNLSVLLRDSFCVHWLAETGNPGRTASEVGLHPGLFARRFGPAAAGVTDSGEYFSLTPRAVGLRNWPRMVKQYLA
jgi:hypothetical protein